MSGYIVVSRPNGQPMELCVGVHYPKGGVLLFGRVASVFPSRPAVRSAIARSAKYGAVFGWDADTYQIMRTADAKLETRATPTKSKPSKQRRKS